VTDERDLRDLTGHGARVTTAFEGKPTRTERREAGSGAAAGAPDHHRG
jgi:hypothetical protein